MAKVEFEKVQVGDTLVTNEKPHYRKNSRLPAYQPNEQVMVDKVFPAGVRVKNKAGVKAEYYFDHGAAKLDYTDETVVAIKKREDFARSEAEEAGAADPTLADLHKGMERMNDQLQATRLELASTKAALAAGNPSQVQLDNMAKELAKTRLELSTALAGAQLTGGPKTAEDLNVALPGDVPANGGGKGKGK